MPRKTAEFRRRSIAARKGWRTRRARKTWTVVLAYISSGNGYRLTFEVTPRKRLSERSVIQLTLQLIRDGHFDDAEENDSKDLRWTASFINSETAFTGPRAHRIGTAYLIDMVRE